MTLCNSICVITRYVYSHYVYKMAKFALCIQKIEAWWCIHNARNYQLHVLNVQFFKSNIIKNTVNYLMDKYFKNVSFL